MRKSLYLLCAALCVLSMARIAAANDDAALPAAAGVVNINTADAAQLALLPHVGKKAAQRVVDYRKDHGHFARTSDLMQVKGFGEKAFERLSPWITVDGKTTLTAKVKSPRKPRTQKASKSRQPSR